MYYNKKKKKISFFPFLAIVLKHKCPNTGVGTRLVKLNEEKGPFKLVQVREGKLTSTG